MILFGLSLGRLGFLAFSAKFRSHKELGKLWADTKHMETGYSGLVASLIRKLVEERKILLLTRHAKKRSLSIVTPMRLWRC